MKKRRIMTAILIAASLCMAALPANAAGYEHLFWGDSWVKYEDAGYVYGRHTSIIVHNLGKTDIYYSIWSYSRQQEIASGTLVPYPGDSDFSQVYDTDQIEDYELRVQCLQAWQCEGEAFMEATD
ncbi:hypothetical protein [Paenibacillus hamazuiensis]|uniref:hypothetical protein n=1 Tax=Paenibacillus hamazuiensis TaxID=2936508 RepID=UPI00201016D5|nr:hypothetical protein [Paenibacillus hamazuiensis]